MGEAFPELKTNAGKVAKVLRDEEAEFLKTIQRGLVHFGKAVEKAQGRRADRTARTAFDLHTTYGFPIDLTEQMAQEQGLDRRSGRLRGGDGANTQKISSEGRKKTRHHRHPGRTADDRRFAEVRRG